MFFSNEISLIKELKSYYMYPVRMRDRSCFLIGFSKVGFAKNLGCSMTLAGYDFF